MAKKSVIVLGAGFGGLRAVMDIAKGLRSAKLLDKYDVILIDRSDCQLYTPLLYKLAAGADVQKETCIYDISALIKNLPIRFVKDEITVLDLEKGNISLKNGEALHADYLVVALGSETNYFGIAGLKENALPLKSVDNALEIRSALEKAFVKSGKVNILVGGAGPNGVELASEIRAWADLAQEENKDSLQVSVSIIEAMSGVLPGFDVSVAAHAVIRLQKLGVAVKTNAKITSVLQNEITIDGGEKMPFDVFVWTGGIKTPDMVSAMPVAKEPHGKPMAKSDMACAPGAPDLQLAPMIYAIGDSVCFLNPKTGKPVPAVARAAILQAGVAANNLLEEIKHAENPSYKTSIKAYQPGDYPYVIPVGENWAVAKFGPVVFWGWLGAIFEKLVALHYLMSIMPFDEALRIWQGM